MHKNEREAVKRQKLDPSPSPRKVPDEDEEARPPRVPKSRWWRRRWCRVGSTADDQRRTRALNCNNHRSPATMPATASVFRICLLLLLFAAFVAACISLPVDKILKDFLVWIKEDLGAWGPLVLILAYIPLTILAVPASILTLGAGYLFGLPMGVLADSVGATLGATAAFFVGRTIGRSYVVSKLNHYPNFQAVAVAIHGSGLKIVFLLRLVPLIPFNVLNYLLAVTPICLAHYVLASWLGMLPMTVAIVYAGTTLKDLSEIGQRWDEVSSADWVYVALGFLVSVFVIVCVTKVAKASLKEVLAEKAEIDAILTPSELPVQEDSDSRLNIEKPLLG